MMEPYELYIRLGEDGTELREKLASLRGDIDIMFARISAGNSVEDLSPVKLNRITQLVTRINLLQKLIEGR